MKFFKYTVSFCIALFLLFFYPKHIVAQNTERPMIWVTPSEKTALLEKIKDNKWTSDYYNSFVKRVQTDVDDYLKDPVQYLGKLPFDYTLQKPNEIPPFKTVNNADKDANAKRNKYQHYVKTGIDCGIIYYITGEEKYAEYATSVFYTFVKAMQQITPSKNEFNGGFIYQDDHLREAREVGAQIPIMYDFIYAYIKKGGLAFNFITLKKEQVSEIEAEKIFKTYIDLALNRGIVDANWPVLESPSLVCNTLALSNQKERQEYLTYYLEKNTPHQDALVKVAKVYKENGNWPESINYSTAVTELTSYLMTLLTKVQPQLHLGIKYPEVLDAISVSYNLTYPNNKDNIIFGDSHRDFHPPIGNYEMAYYLGSLENSASIKSKYGSLLKSAISSAGYDRSKLQPRSYVAHPYFDEPLKLLWFNATIEGSTKEFVKPTTNELPFAGIVVQRNLSSTNNSKDALMGFVGGSAFVHGHASGMNMELYGQGHVLGTKGGRGNYGSEIHENYYRLFAGHNTVIVNGASQGAGKWVNLAINTVKTEALEPLPSKVPVSSKYSFTTSSFVDDKSDNTQAQQQRTLAIVRTSATTGYYVDVFKSKSTLPNQFHDYVYHNVGDELIFETSDKDFVTKPDEKRYQASATKAWKQNAEYRNPGWHYFKNVETSGVYEKSLNVTFVAKALEKEPVNMTLFIPGAVGREYTKVMAPPSSESGSIYSKKLTPTLLIRQNGDAWNKPFAVVFESSTGNKALDSTSLSSVKEVTNIYKNDVFKGLIVNSVVNLKPIKQIIIMQQNDTDVYEDASIKFKGKYAVVTFNNKFEMTELYVGSGTSFSFKNFHLKSSDNNPLAASITKSSKNISVTSTRKVAVNVPTNFKVDRKIINN